jgi:D-amino-acid oxidase
MQRYLPWLRDRCEARGVRFEERTVRGWGQLLDRYDLVVNCTGLRATELVTDRELYPVRGQYLILRPGAEVPTTYVGDDEHPEGMAYMIPRDGEVLVGGTEEPEEWSLDFVASPEDILRRASQFVSVDLTAMEVVRQVVGLRPARRSGRVRLGRDIDESRVIHNYGHGGSGYSLSWGCAEEVATLVSQILR